MLRVVRLGSAERVRESSEHHKISVKLDVLQAADTEWRESVLMLQTPELA